ncbi:hypothetical protein HYALB_00008261 [Hymenoscyphus albidus]|uniref:Acetoin dehydrogenase-like protein n=1 Tax=Hymenoscyphus albidus TaxID=595503 RepID=A0A9N9Q4S3_9HELO|nr:hypothetical protein HYALB_00008261 [Hymenoscyphus albidus]
MLWNVERGTAHATCIPTAGLHLPLLINVILFVGTSFELYCSQELPSSTVKSQENYEQHMSNMASTETSSSSAVTENQGKRTAIVTGAARGIGKAIALRLAKDGYDICINDLSLNQAGIDEVFLPISSNFIVYDLPIYSYNFQTVKEIQALGRKSYGHTADVSKRSDVEALVEASVQNLGPLNTMVANAGISQVKSVLEMTEEDVSHMFEINVYGVFNCYSVAAKQMIKQGNGGKILGCASIVAFRPFVNMTHYSASKWAVRGFTQGFAMELAEHKITVNGYAPGIVGTPMWEMLDEKLGEKLGAQKGETIKQFGEKIALGRLSVPDDVAKCVSYLAGPDSDYMTGQTLIIDGGIQFS